MERRLPLRENRRDLSRRLPLLSLELASSFGLPTDSTSVDNACDGTIYNGNNFHLDPEVQDFGLR